MNGNAHTAPVAEQRVRNANGNRSHEVVLSFGFLSLRLKLRMNPLLAVEAVNEHRRFSSH